MSAISLGAFMVAMSLFVCVIGYMVVKDTLSLQVRTKLERLGGSPAPFAIAVLCCGILFVEFLVSRQWLGAFNASAALANLAIVFYRHRPRSSKTHTEAEPRA